MSFVDKKISTTQAIAILAKKDIKVDGDEAAVILDFLYLMAKNYKKPTGNKKIQNLKEKSNF